MTEIVITQSKVTKLALEIQDRRQYFVGCLPGYIDQMNVLLKMEGADCALMQSIQANKQATEQFLKFLDPDFKTKEEFDSEKAIQLENEAKRIREAK